MCVTPKVLRNSMNKIDTKSALYRWVAPHLIRVERLFGSHMLAHKRLPKRRLTGRSLLISSSYLWSSVLSFSATGLGEGTQDVTMRDLVCIWWLRELADIGYKFGSRSYCGMRHACWRIILRLSSFRAYSFVVEGYRVFVSNPDKLRKWSPD
jgi:hypothetical protein